MEANELANARTIWRYMQLKAELEPADCLVVLGSRDDRVASYAAGLMSRSIYAKTPAIVIGGMAHANDLLSTSWPELTEAEHFAAVMVAAGVSVDRLLLEEQAANTGENATLSFEVAQKLPEMPKKLLIITKPYMERRALATFEAQWPDPDVELQVTSTGQSLTDYVNDEQPLTQIVNIMVGDLDRIIKYPKQGWQSAQPVPREVLAAANQLNEAGFDQHAIN